MKVVMLGADRSVKGGVSAVVNNLYEAGLDQRIDLTYIGTMVDGSTAAKLLKGVQALLQFVTVLPKADIVHLNMAADASCYRRYVNTIIDSCDFCRIKYRTGSFICCRMENGNMGCGGSNCVGTVYRIGHLLFLYDS